MAVNESLDALDVVAASNTPAGTDRVGTDLDNHLRDIKKNIRTESEHSQAILNPTGFEGQLHADKSRSASGIITLRIHDGDAWVDLLEVKTADNKISVLNLADSSIPGLALRASEFSASAIAPAALNLGALSASEIPSIALNLTPLAVTRGGIAQESSASASAYINALLGTLKDLSRASEVGDADIAISSEATGDILVHGGAGGDWNRKAIGSASEMLHVVGGTWGLRSPPQAGADLQEFTGSGTYTKPAGAVGVLVGAGHQRLNRYALVGTHRLAEGCFQDR
ncbi:hypothetical protein LCGC14_2880030, partial [marine sediment metagenome]